MDNKILVIGATSKVGTELVDALVAKGETVKAATRRPGDYRPPPGVEVAAFDYDEYRSFKTALQDVDRVFMLTKWTDPRPDMALSRFFELAIVDKIKHIVFMSVQGIDHKPAEGLQRAEKHLSDGGLGYTILNPNWFMQNFSRGFFLPRIRDISSFVAPAGRAAASFVDTRDVAAVAVAALTDSAPHSGKTYALTGGQAHTFEEVADVLADVLERPISYREADPEEFAASLTDYWGAAQIDYLLSLFAFVREDQAEPVEPTVASILGREPTTFEQFARDHVEVWA